MLDYLYFLNVEPHFVFHTGTSSAALGAAVRSARAAAGSAGILLAWAPGYVAHSPRAACRSELQIASPHGLPELQIASPHGLPEPQAASLHGHPGCADTGRCRHA
jgi:hypothetical protein